jgi:hypothetical protein
MYFIMLMQWDRHIRPQSAMLDLRHALPGNAASVRQEMGIGMLAGCKGRQTAAPANCAGMAEGGAVGCRLLEGLILRDG